MTKLKTIMLAAMGVAIAGGAVATSASAETRFQANHPRRVEVNHRLALETHRIHRERREGLISAQKAAHLHRQVHMIRREEKIDARFDRSHITRADQRVLNHQENHVTRELNR